jgi:hypothetical protein
MTLPQVQRIISVARKEPFDDPDWLFDFKYDGFRSLLYFEEGSCRLISRNGNALSRFAALCHPSSRYRALARSVPPIDDITSDTDNPPAFVAVIKLRRAEDGNPSTYAGAETAALQRGGYPDLVPLTAALTKPQVNLETAGSIA